jgi:predicted RNA-binding Zn-ribbon protein involved in translation (DUF1610 family)
MEKSADKVEFLCLRCGLQGLCAVVEPEPVDECGVLCPKCGEHVITTHLLEMEKEQSLLVTV